MDHEEFVLNIISNVNSNGYIKCRERVDLEYKETFSAGNFSKYAKRWLLSQIEVEDILSLE